MAVGDFFELSTEDLAAGSTHDFELPSAGTAAEIHSLYYEKDCTWYLIVDTDDDDAVEITIELFSLTGPGMSQQNKIELLFPEGATNPKISLRVKNDDAADAGDFGITGMYVGA
jgi:hypothetical protein